MTGDVRREGYWGKVDGKTGSPSRPSKTNCTTENRASENGESDSRLSDRYWWKRKNEVVDRVQDEMPERAARPAAVREKEKLREDCTLDHNNGGYRSDTMLPIIGNFCKWYNGYRRAHLRFRDPDGNLVRSKLENSHQPGYGNKYYARFKALERQVIHQYDNPYSVILTFSGSHRNATDGWRCPVDHLRDVVDTWRPDRTRGVYHVLRDVLDGRDWEYCVAVEHNSKGYGHVHVGVFVDGEISKEQFHPVIDRHLELCDIAHPDAHDYYHSDPEKRPISVKRIDPAEYNGEDDLAERVDDPKNDLANLGSYLAEYIGAADDSELFDRSSEELFFRAACWASGTQRVRFSTGANEMIADDLDRSEPIDTIQEYGWKEGVTEVDIKDATDDPDRSINELSEEDPGWSVDGIGRVDQDGEDVYEIRHSAVQYREIEGAESLDPPASQPSRPPTPDYQNGDLSSYSDG